MIDTLATCLALGNLIDVSASNEITLGITARMVRTIRKLDWMGHTCQLAFSSPLETSLLKSLEIYVFSTINLLCYPYLMPLVECGPNDFMLKGLWSFWSKYKEKLLYKGYSNHFAHGLTWIPYGSVPSCKTSLGGI